MVTKSEALRALAWLDEVVDEYSMQTALSLATHPPEEVTGRQAAVAIAKTHGAAELLQLARNLLEKVQEEE